jgi:CHAD domain-containing protein
MTVETLTATNATTRIDHMLDIYRVDMPHARHVANLALALFDGTRELHGMNQRARRLLELGALLHNVGLNIDQPTHHLVGRDIVLSDGFTDLQGSERAIIACLVAFHRKKVRPQQEPTFLRLRKKDQATALRLAALLRIADGLDYSGAQRTRIQHCEVRGAEVALTIAGPDSEEDGARASKKADLWRKVLDSVVVITIEPGSLEERTAPDAAAEEEAAPPEDVPPLVSSFSPLADLGRRTLRTNFQALLENEHLVLAEKDPVEGVHQMRVATRRLRAILQIIDAVAPAARVRHFRKELKRVARALSPVRDCDVLLEQAEDYRAQLDEPDEATRAGMAPLVDALERERATGRSSMFEFLNGERYATFKREFAAFVTDSPREWNTEARVRDMLGSNIWQRYEDLRAQIDALDAADDPATVDPEELHQARILGKRLRYVLEMADEVLEAKRVSKATKPLKALQDHLGALQDMAVEADYVRGLGDEAAAQPILAGYVASREETRARLLNEVPRHLQQMSSKTYRRALVELLVTL